ncbi:MAG: type IV pilus modification protein PilV [Methylovulum sp.]|uniref:type IV pilus modification protein PilV n=1 Tax=Methylovulum sp. TaxID=1916980 RepID=UPI0026105125|nr:type IV pilus modification protein PilV [Methylovulum sp.]MDD2724767.1 type IV pilus modification protein PilV [Methylovulum sp.]MDD5124375.1 type IV pilus modification protein PilV [Methylovulum sp.]
MNNSSGFTLIEVLIAMLVLAAGLLGLAGLQATSLGNNQGAYNRSQATQYANDLADRIRANAGAVGSYIADPTTAAAKPGCQSTTGCSPADMAENDLYEWNLALIAALPVNAVNIGQIAGIITISISWDENHDGVVDGDDPDFLTSFRL